MMGIREILVANEATNEGPRVKSYIFTYAGGRNFTPLDSIPYPYSIGAQGIQPADLNGDGVLDLVVANTKDYETGSWEVNSCILFGLSPVLGGFHPVFLPAFGGHPTAIADLNGDEFLDIVFPSNANNTTGWETEMVIYWGHENGSYGPWDPTRLPVFNNWECQLADLNLDGWLDILAVNGKNNQGYYTTDRIYWGPDFTAFTELPGVASANITIRDANLDGRLDLLISNWARGFDGAETLQTYSYLRYGPDYITGPVDSFPTCGAHGNMIADWNGDGWPDIFIGNEMIVWGQYYDTSFVYWNSPDGFDTENRTEIEVWAPNDCAWTDLGNIYDRTPTERYLSSEHSLDLDGRIVSVDSLRFHGNIPEGMSVSAWVRTGHGPWWDRWIRIGEDGRPVEPVVRGEKIQYRLVFALDYRNTTLFRIDSVMVFYRAENLFGTIKENESPESQDAKNWEIYDAAGRLIKKRKSGQLPRGVYFRVERKNGRPVSAGVFLE